MSTTARRTTKPVADGGQMLSIPEQQVAALPRVKADAINAEALAAIAAEMAGQADLDDTAADEIEARWDSGDGEPTELDYVIAQAKGRKSRGLAKAAAAKAERAKREVVSTDNRLAVAVADVLASVFGGVPCEGTWLPSPLPPSVPYAIVTGPGGEGRDGVLSGVVEVKLYRHALHRELHPTELVRALTNARAQAEATGGVQRRPADAGGVIGETLRIKVGGVIPAVPTMKGEPTEYALSKLAFNLAGHLAGRFVDDRGVKLTERNTFNTRYVSTAGHGGHVVSKDVDGNGERTVTADLVVYARPVSQTMGYNVADNEIRQALSVIAADMVGDLASGLGRVTSATLVGVSGRAEPGQVDRRYGVRLTCVSRAAGSRAEAP